MSTSIQELKVLEPSVLLDFLVESQIRKSRNATKALLAKKLIKVNGHLQTQYNLPLQIGDIITVIANDDNKRDTKKLEGLTVVFEDEYFIVVDKEPRLLSVSTGKTTDITAYNIVSKYIKSTNPKGRVFVLHRLDRETSGLMVYAKSSKIQELLQKEWTDIIDNKTYIVVVEGKPTPDKGTITAWLTENKNYVVFANNFDNGGLKSVTHFETVASSNKYSMLRLTLDTQRKNQARVHMQHLGHPIVGDKKYGARNNPIKRVAIHASELSIKHPYTGELLEFKSNIPAKMRSLIEQPKKD